MRFEFCGNLDCPEWVLSEIVLLNKISAIKLRLILIQIIKKIMGQPYDQDKLIKLCKDQKLSADDTKVFLSVIEFILAQAGKHIVSDQTFSKDLLQLGIAIENANAMVKVYTDNFDNLSRALKAQFFRVSQIQGMQYKVSYLFASSATGQQQNMESGAVEPLDTAITLKIDLNEFNSSEASAKKPIKFGMTKDKFLQFTKDMKEALTLLESATTIE